MLRALGSSSTRAAADQTTPSATDHKRDDDEKRETEEDDDDDEGDDDERGGRQTKGWGRFMNKRPTRNTPYIPTDLEQIANIITHGVWILPSLGGLWLMHQMSRSSAQRLAVSVYGASIFLLFSVSTAFHSLAYYGRSTQLKTFFHIGDRVAIYIFIAASYTPWLALKDFNRFGTPMIWLVWIAAVLGTTYQYKFHERCKWLETLIYIFIATTPSIIILEMKEPSGVAELAAGGVAYFLGVVFFKSDGLIPFAHAIWHVLVIVGASIHYIAVCRYLLGPCPDDASCQSNS